MNVYKLADALEKIETYNQVIHRSFNDKTKLTASADMLRQQADRIAELEKGGEVAGRFYWESVVDGHVMAVPSEGTPHYNKDDFPLYTAPRELSDEEIIEIGNAVVNLIDSNEGWIEFAKAILKKASEK
jgi:hypothetical protein